MSDRRQRIRELAQADVDNGEQGTRGMYARELVAIYEQLEAMREELDEAEAKVREAQGVAVREWERNKEFRRQREDARYAAALTDDQDALASNPAKSQTKDLTEDEGIHDAFDANAWE